MNKSDKIIHIRQKAIVYLQFFRPFHWDNWRSSFNKTNWFVSLTNTEEKHGTIIALKQEEEEEWPILSFVASKFEEVQHSTNKMKHVHWATATLRNLLQWPGVPLVRQWLERWPILCEVWRPAPDSAHTSAWIFCSLALMDQPCLTLADEPHHHQNLPAVWYHLIQPGKQDLLIKKAFSLK